MPNSISQEAFVADYAHVDQGTAHAGRQKIFAETRKSGRVRAAEKVRRDRQIELIDQASLEQRSEKSRAAFTGDFPHFVCLPAASANIAARSTCLRRSVQVQSGLLPHATCLNCSGIREVEKNDHGRNVGLKDFQAIVDLPLIGDDYPKRGQGLSIA